MAPHLILEGSVYGPWLRWTIPCELVLSLLPTDARARLDERTGQILAVTLVAASSHQIDINALPSWPDNDYRATLWSTTYR